MPELKVWLKDAEGYLIGEVEASGEKVDSFETFAKNAEANGHIAIEKGDDPEATKPPMRPPTPDQAARSAKAARLADLRAIGWTKLSADQKAEADALRFDLGTA